MFFSFLPFGIHIHTMNNYLKQYKIVGMLSNQQLLQANARRNDDNPLTVKSVGAPDIIGHFGLIVWVIFFFSFYELHKHARCLTVSPTQVVGTPIKKLSFPEYRARIWHLSPT